MRFTKLNNERFISFLGGSILILSAGLSIAIARTDNLEFLSNGRKLALSQRILSAEQKTRQLEQLTETLAKSHKNKEIKIELENSLGQLRGEQEAMLSIIGARPSNECFNLESELENSLEKE